MGRPSRTGHLQKVFGELTHVSACPCVKEIEGKHPPQKGPRQTSIAHLSTRALRRLMVRSIPLVLRCGFKHVKVHTPTWPHFENTRRVAATITIVGCGPYRGEVLVKEGRVAFHAELVCAEDVRHVVCLEKFVDDARAKGVSRTPINTTITIQNKGISAFSTWGKKQEVCSGVCGAQPPTRPCCGRPYRPG